jgi:uncharacterized coiled-coil protein SlyX
MAQHSSDPLSLGPDGYSRFFVIMGLLENFYKGSTRTIRILDVGGCSPFLGDLLKKSPLKTDLTIIDILPKPDDVNATYIQGDATKTDMPDGAYDVVITTDVLEHIPPKSKDVFVAACARLAKDVCIIAAPFDTPGVHQAEVMVNEFNKRLFGVGQDWLEEHFEFKKPSVDATMAVLKKHGAPYTHFGTNNLYSWIFSAHMNLLDAKVGIDAKKSLAIKRHYNRLLAHSPEFMEPSYRHFFVVYNKKELARYDVPGVLQDKFEPETLLGFMHDMMDAVTDRLIEFTGKHSRQANENERLNVQLAEQQRVIDAQAQELKSLGLLRHVSKLRHPKRVARAIKRRLKGEK